MVWTELNGVEVSSREKSKTFGSWNVLFVQGDEGKEKIFLVVYKLKDILLKIEKSQQVEFEKSGADKIKNSDGDDKEWGDK